MAALAHLYQVSPSIQAAKTILCGQLLSSGVVVRRAGRDVPLKDNFSRHLESVWVPFARTVIDQFLMFGFCLVSLEEEPPAPFANFLKGRDAVGTTDMGIVARAESRCAPSTTVTASIAPAPPALLLPPTAAALALVVVEAMETPIVEATAVPPAAQMFDPAPEGS